MDKIFTIKVAEELVKLMDRRFSLFGIRFGIDPIIGLIPVIGDFMPLIVSLYVIAVALKEKISLFDIVRMISNMLLDALLGSVPVVGDIFDFVFSAHMRNFNLLKKRLEARQ